MVLKKKKKKNRKAAALAVVSSRNLRCTPFGSLFLLLSSPLIKQYLYTVSNVRSLTLDWDIPGKALLSNGQLVISYGPWLLGPAGTCTILGLDLLKCDMNLVCPKIHVIKLREKQKNKTKQKFYGNIMKIIILEYFSFFLFGSLIE